MGAPAFVPNSIIVVEPVGTHVQLPGQDVCLYAHTRQTFQQLRGRTAPLWLFRAEHLCHRFQKRVGRQLPKFRFGSLKLPHAAFPVELQRQLLIRLVASNDVQQGGVVRAPLLLHDECSIRCTQQAIGARDHIEAILGFHLPGVVNHQQADAVPVAESFQFGHDLVVAGVAVSVTADLPHLLQGVDDDEPHIWMLPDEAFQLLVKSLAHGLGLRCEVEIAGLLHPEHPGEPPLQPGVIVL